MTLLEIIHEWDVLIAAQCVESILTERTVHLKKVPSVTNILLINHSQVYPVTNGKMYQRLSKFIIQITIIIHTRQNRSKF